MARLPNFLVIIRSEKLSGKGQGRGVGVRKKERFVLGKRTFRSQKSKHFVLRIIYFFLNSDVVRLFADGGFGFSTSKTKGNDALNSWNIGIKPGIAIKLSDHFCLVAKYGFLGYSKKENHGYESENVGIDFDTDELNFGFHYIF